MPYEEIETGGLVVCRESGSLSGRPATDKRGFEDVMKEILDAPGGGKESLEKQRSHVPNGSARPSLENPPPDLVEREGRLMAAMGKPLAPAAAAASGKARRTSFLIAEEEDGGEGLGTAKAGGRISPMKGGKDKEAAGVGHPPKERAAFGVGVGVGGGGSEASGNDDDARSSQAGSEAELSAAGAQQAAANQIDQR